MKVKSCFSTNLDPYSAGVEIGEILSVINPEVIFVFSSIHYNGSPELAEAIYDTLESENIIIIGNTGDGIYEFNNVANVGVSALAINSNGEVKWNITYETGIKTQPYNCTVKCIDKLKSINNNKGSELYFVASNFDTDSSLIIKALQETVDGQVIGGLASDDYKLQNSYVYVNKDVLSDGIAILSIDGNIAFDIELARNMNPVGDIGVITDCDGVFVHTIDNIAATDFINNELGKPLNSIDEGIITLKLTKNIDNEDSRVRSLFLPENSSKSIKLAGGIKDGDNAQLCLSSPEEIISDVTNIAKNTNILPFKPLAAIIVSCAGRKKVLADNIKDEVIELISNCPSIEALAGYPSLGEIGPIKNKNGYSKTLFHNMTFIVLLIGEKN